jgi:hypothetical protein
MRVANPQIARCLLLALAVAFAVAWPVVSVADERDDNVIDYFPIPKNGDPIAVPVHIGGRQYSFLLDTGAGVSVFDRTLSEPMGSLTWYVRPLLVNSEREVYTFDCPEGTFVGAKRLPLVGRGIFQDLSELRDAVAHDFTGILGADFLRQYVVQIDFDAGRVSLLRSCDRIRGVPLPVKWTSRCPTVTVNLPAVGETQFVVDTGCIGFTHGSLNNATFEKLRDAQKLSFVEPSRLMTINGVVEGRSGLLADPFSVGDVRHVRNFFTEGPGNALGIGFLSRHKVTLDFPKGVAILEKGKFFDRELPPNRAGLEIEIKTGTPVVCDVHPGGIASRCGIHAGDEIVEVNGRTAGEMSIFAINDVLDWANVEARLTLKRGSEAGVCEVIVSAKRAAASDSSQRKLPPR